MVRPASSQRRLGRPAQAILLLAAIGVAAFLVLRRAPEPPRTPEPPLVAVPEPEPPPEPAPALPPPLHGCSLLTILIDSSPQGDQELAQRAEVAMSSELLRFGARTTHSPADAYWSLMILASNNERHDGYIFSALLAARNMHEGDAGGLASYVGEEAETEDVETALPTAGASVPSMYNGLSYGPYASLEDQAREYVRRAYEAVFPAAQSLCNFEAADKARESEIESQLPNQPQPL